ncbi:ribbon-helix-helix domain-containing protein [Natronomonas sp. F2-12]|jgi:metal-responsive CopG/Arc/MetJ family transcriptional regulator|uniref:Ribbon-helix-helix domain-containing protein n=1 Tax=Natronomonas aquatica TaxID=2841590 RepID=A0A9R1CSX3_9EURY|nr:ribbon-helix-helix domain-containing protein [Natronomonas aquatica]MCQ4333213.1 ribbon-helix-helix domain-containing protein [Natronomonas aquatica]
MPPSDEAVEIDIAFDDGLLARIDRLCHTPGYDTRSDVVAAAIEAKGE